jgi:hypothetical protein
MSATETKSQTPGGVPAALFTRVLDEGYGPGAWYGSDMRAAIASVRHTDAFKRPAPGRHNIAEVALHHAYWVGQIESKLAGGAPGAFPLVGEDWFELDGERKLSWSAIVTLVDAAQQRLSRTVGEIAGGDRPSPLGEGERFDLVVGITGHAAYHAGQIQLIRKLI